MQSCRLFFDSESDLRDYQESSLLYTSRFANTYICKRAKVFFLASRPRDSFAWARDRNLRAMCAVQKPGKRAEEELHRVCPPPALSPRLGFAFKCLPACSDSELYHVSTANSLFMNKKCGRPTKGPSCLCFVKCAGDKTARRVTSPRAVQDARDLAGQLAWKLLPAGRLPWRSAHHPPLTNPDAYS